MSVDAEDIDALGNSHMELHTFVGIVVKNIMLRLSGSVYRASSYEKVMSNKADKKIAVNGGSNQQVPPKIHI